MSQETFIVVVTFNALPWVEKCFGSIRSAGLLSQTIVVDNASSDDTVNIITSSFPEVLIITQDENLGFGRSNNIGIDYAINHGAQHLFLMNQDAIIESDTISKLIATADLHPEYGILSPLQLNSNNQLDYLFESYLRASNIDPESSKEIEEVMFCNAALWLINASTFRKIGGFDPIFPHYGEDKDLVNRAQFHGLKIGVCPQIKAIHDRDSSQTRPITQRKYFEYISYLVDLKNPKLEFEATYKRIQKTIRKYIFRESLRFQRSQKKLDIKHRAMLHDNLDNLKEHKALCLTRGPHFLNLK